MSTAKQRAEERYPAHTEPDAVIGVTPWQFTRLAYAACVREEVEPLEAEVERLRGLLKEAEGALRPFTQEGLMHQSEAMRKMGDDAPVYGREKAMVTHGDFRRAAEALSKLMSEPK